MDFINLPLYEGSESSNEDIVYNYFRRILNQNGYSFKIKRSGFPEIDGIVPSYSSGKVGKGICDAYIFSGTTYQTFLGLLELESTGNLDEGIKQINTYLNGFTSKLLDNQQKMYIDKIVKKEILGIVYDGQKIYICEYSLITNKTNIILDKISVAENLNDVSSKIYELFKHKEEINRESDEKKLIDDIAKIIRGHEKLQKNKALLMTILASIYGTTKQIAYSEAIESLESSQTDYDIKLYDTLKQFMKDIPEKNDIDKIPVLYENTSSKLYEMSQDRGMDLYGFIYEELASKESKKEQGEYYTPRHTIRPLIKAVYSNYLNWDVDDIKDKIIFDPFCGSGGFLYEYISIIKSIHNLDKKHIDNIARKTIWGVDKNNVLAAYLNLFLIGDGSANIQRVKTSINWRKQFLYKNHQNKKFKVVRIKDSYSVKYNLKSSVADLQTFLKLYVNKNFSLDLDDLCEFIDKETNNPICDYIIKNRNLKKIGKSDDYLGNVDLLLTNIPYGKVTEANEQFIDSGDALYKNSLEANGLRECIDFLKPAKFRNGKIIEEGGIAITIVPDSILENPSNKSIRDYLISRCNILGIVGLPPYTFSPYAMEKTYALIFQKIAPEQFDYNRELDLLCFMYYSICDGKANSQNRFKTDLVTKSKISTKGGKEKEVIEFVHNDFESCFDTFEDDKWIYKSKLEWAFDYNFANLNPGWDQKRITESWTGKNWQILEGKKWGYYKLLRYKREVEKMINMKSLEEKVAIFFETIDEEEKVNFVGADNFDDFKNKFKKSSKLTPKEEQKLEELDFIKYTKVLDINEIQLVKIEIIDDVDINPDSNRYLGVKEKIIDIKDIYKELEKIEIDENILIDFFRNKFTSSTIEAIKILDKFDVIQGTQFSKRDAYKYPGNVPVYTAATDGPAYYVSNDIPDKVKINGPSLVWSRKGAKAGTIQLFSEKSEFYISDVSGTIKPKNEVCDNELLFFKYYIAGQVKRELQSKSNNAQLNKSKLENLKIFIPEDIVSIGQLIKEKLNL